MQVIQRDGVGEGDDLELIRLLTDALTVSLVACSGVGRFEVMPRELQRADRLGKKALDKAGVPVRK